jgi:hypothetical protein
MKTNLPLTIAFLGVVATFSTQVSAGSQGHNKAFYKLIRDKIDELRVYAENFFEANKYSLSPTPDYP